MATSGFRDKVKGLVGSLRSGDIQVQTVDGVAFCCAWCNKVRDEQSDWHHLEPDHLQQLGVKVSHTICPQCKIKYVQEFKQVLQPVSH